MKLRELSGWSEIKGLLERGDFHLGQNFANAVQLGAQLPPSPRAGSPRNRRCQGSPRELVLQFVKAPLHHVADRYDAGSRLSSTTGKCRNFAAVVRAIIPITVSFMPQLAT